MHSVIDVSFSDCSGINALSNEGSINTKFLANPEFTIATRRSARLFSGDDVNTVVSIPEMML